MASVWFLAPGCHYLHGWRLPGEHHGRPDGLSGRIGVHEEGCLDRLMRLHVGAGGGDVDVDCDVAIRNDELHA